MKNISIYILSVALLASACIKKDVAYYSISKVTKSDTASKVIVNIKARLTKDQLLGIAGKIKSDSAALPNLQLCYMLPGHNDKNTGSNNFYAIAKYPSAQTATMQDTLKDSEGNVVRLKITGVSAQMAQKLVNFHPKELKDQNFFGHFIDDNNHTVIIPFRDLTDPKKEYYILELDTTGKVVSATIPTVVTKDGIEKWFVTDRGDYITIKDSILTQYSIDDLGMPYNSIKSGL
ncbi:hypothetical protein [Mucilaginibacter ginsenosidivorax]|uniref:Lipoprotein n=1 Tax=Mucilaginibacter ginsenosidivorax TaxID=862126 RepID=A0A5B8W124_9SPHI|nr:hypothetical protein [Mucilaginibacter ginsenosidivorax]QEC75938.1 hypothetical protein FSB76_08250 [Mucilaginibacter ginsenosidivorax]